MPNQKPAEHSSPPIPASATQSSLPVSEPKQTEQTFAPKFSEGVQVHELKQVDLRRRLVHGATPPDSEEPLKRDLVGLALSGGGIRSATFNLGILQALANLKLLSRIDFLSSVSGGGYIAGWLSAWIQREQATTDENEKKTLIPGVLNVEKQLSPNRIDQAEAVRGVDATLAHKPLAAEPEPIYHLRSYSRFLSPRFGILSLDTWALGGLYLRNLLANVMLFVFMAAALALFCRLIVHVFNLPQQDDVLSILLLGIALAMLLIGQGSYRWFLGTVRIRNREAESKQGGIAGKVPVNAASGVAAEPKVTGGSESALLVFLWMVLPSVFAGCLLCWLLAADPVKHRDAQSSQCGSGFTRLPECLRPTSKTPPPLIRVLKPFRLITDGHLNARGEYVLFGLAFAIIGLVMYPIGNWMERLRTRHRSKHSLGVEFRMWLASCAFGFHVGFLLCALRNNVLLPPEPVPTSWVTLWNSLWVHSAVVPTTPDAMTWACVVASFGVPLFLIAVVVGGYCDVIVCGPALSEYEREWRGRAGAMMLQFAILWAIVFSVILFVPWLIQKYKAETGAEVLGIASVLGLYLYRSTLTTTSSPSTTTWSRFGGWIFVLVPPILLVGGFSLISYLIQNLPYLGGDSPDFLYRIATVNEQTRWLYLMIIAGWFVLIALLGALHAWCVHPNLFSLHSV